MQPKIELSFLVAGLQEVAEACKRGPRHHPWVLT